MAGLRFVVAGAVLHAPLRLRGEPRPARREVASGSLVGILLVGANALATSCAYVNPAVAMGLGLLAGERPPAQAFAALPLSWLASASSPRGRGAARRPALARA